MLNILFNRLLNLSSGFRFCIKFFLDSLIILIAIFISFYISQNSNLLSFNSYYWLIPFSLIIGQLVFIFTSQYKSIIRYVGSKDLYLIIYRSIVISSLLIILGYAFQKKIPSISYWINFTLFLPILNGSLRLIFRDFLLSVGVSNTCPRKKVVIYGAGSAGVQLAASFRFARTHVVEFFIDDNTELWGRNLNGVNIYSPSLIEKKKYRNFDQILLALPSISNLRRRQILKNLAKFEVPVLSVPSLNQITSNKAKIDMLKPIGFDHFLGREPLPSSPEFSGSDIKDGIICVTGAGGSIGSELCFQIAKLSPKSLIMIDNSESNLYKVHQDVCQIKDSSFLIKPLLVDVSNENLLDFYFKKYKVEIVFHAAAYKHVPLVEDNPIQGLANNVFSTMSVCSVAQKNNLKKVLLISTDKAVRPSSIMGASKRLSEIILLNYANKKNIFVKDGIANRTIFTLVRFGNVLGSSGSVIPLFTKQIEIGGPVTVTNREVIRYFMTISEAVELVLQASAMSKGGELYLLEMGEQVKIIDLAKQLINLSGLTVKSDKNPNGDIEIIFTGLRPGEKLFEELLIDSKALPTENPRIYQAVDKLTDYDSDYLFLKLYELRKAIQEIKKDKVMQILNDLVDEWSYKKK